MVEYQSIFIVVIQLYILACITFVVRNEIPLAIDDVCGIKFE